MFRIFELSRNEQRIVLIVMLILIAIAFVEYERRVHQRPVQQTSVTEANRSATPAQTEDER